MKGAMSVPYATNPNDGIRIYYEVEGEGTALFLYPGATFSHQVMSEYAYTSALSEPHVNVLIDPRGTGQSDKPHEGSAHTLDCLVGDVIAILDDLDIEQTHYLGYSRGGWVGFGLAAKAPDRLLSLVSGGMHPYPREAGRELQNMAGVVDFIESTYGPLKPNTRDDLLASDVAALNAANRGVSESARLEAALTDITTPCMLYCGKEDPNHGDAFRAAREIPNASFLSLHGLNHITAGTQTEVTLPHIQAFLERVDSAH